MELHECLYTAANRTLDGGTGMGVVAHTPSWPMSTNLVATPLARWCTRQDLPAADDTSVQIDYIAAGTDSPSVLVLRRNTGLDHSGRPGRYLTRLLVAAPDENVGLAHAVRTAVAVAPTTYWPLNADPDPARPMVHVPDPSPEPLTHDDIPALAALLDILQGHNARLAMSTEYLSRLLDALPILRVTDTWSWHQGADRHPAQHWLVSEPKLSFASEWMADPSGRPVVASPKSMEAARQIITGSTRLALDPNKSWVEAISQMTCPIPAAPAAVAPVAPVEPQLPVPSVGAESVIPTPTRPSVKSTVLHRWRDGAAMMTPLLFLAPAVMAQWSPQAALWLAAASALVWWTAKWWSHRKNPVV